jgi:hypothetical protein
MLTATTAREERLLLRPRLEFAAKAFILTSFAGALAAGALRLSDHAFGSREHRIELSRWAVTERPAWSTLDDVRGIRDASGLASYHASLFDAPALSTVDAYLARSPNVRRVAAVRRVWPNKLEAVLEMRRPVVAVRIPGSPAAKSLPVKGKAPPAAAARPDAYVEADEDGVALGPPLAARPLREGHPLRVVAGAAGVAPRPGGTFGPDVRAAASIASSLDDFSDAKGREVLSWLDRIDVSNYGGRLHPGASEVLLLATPPVPSPGTAAPKIGTGVVEWGRAGEREADGHEMPFDGKASRVLQALRLFPHLEGLRSVRVAFTDLVVVPEASAPPDALKRALEIDGGVQAK